MQQLANLVKSQPCKESHVHNNVLVFLPNASTKSLFRFFEDLHVFHDGSRKAIRVDIGFLEGLLLLSFLLEHSDEHVHLPNESDGNLFYVN